MSKAKLTKVQRVMNRGYIAALRGLVLASMVKHDGECRCGTEPYTDGLTCPQCNAVEVFELLYLDAKYIGDALAAPSPETEARRG